MFKVCKRCNIEKPLAAFGKRSSEKDGLNYYCRECNYAGVKSWIERNRNKKRAQGKKWKQDNPEKVKASSVRRYEEKKEDILSKNKEWKDANPEKVIYRRKKRYEEKKNEILLKGKIHRQNNRPKYNAKAAKERAARHRATPIWLTDLDKMQIEWYYAAAKMMTETTGIEHHVDHIHPIKGKGFTGLHVPWNLRCIPALDNLSKGNKLIEEL